MNYEPAIRSQMAENAEAAYRRESTVQTHQLTPCYDVFNEQ
jgi:hypothetical protein